MRQASARKDGKAARPLGEGSQRLLLRELAEHAPDLAGFHDPLTASAGDSMPLNAAPLLAALDAAHIGIVQMRHDRTIASANAAFCRIAARRIVDLADRPIEDFLHPEDAAPFTEAFLTHAERVAAFACEHRYVLPDGEHRRASIQVSFVEPGDGSPVTAIAVVEDITDRYDTASRLRDLEAHYRRGVELAPQISWTASPSGLVLDVSHRLGKMMDASSVDAIGEGWKKRLHPDDLQRTLDAWAESLRTKRPFDVEYRVCAPDGSDRWFRSRAMPHFGKAQKVLRWYGTLEDIDDRKRTEQALRESEQRFRLAAQAAGLGVWDYDAIRDQRRWSDDFKSMLGLPQDTAPLIETAHALVVPEDRHLLEELITAVYLGKSQHRFEKLLRIRRADNGAEHWMQTTGWRIEAPDGSLERILVTIMDVTEKRNAAERIQFTAHHDALTGLPNRAFFGEALEDAIGKARQRDGTLALVVFDVDNLKETNDTIGHDAGDMLLQTFVKGLRDVLGTRAFLARLGGDEFAAFFDVTDEDEIVALVDAALVAGKRDFKCDGVTLMCEATAGAAQFPRDGRTAKDLLKTADIALYAGKAGPKGMLSLFKPEMRARVERRATMLAVARSVIADDRLVPFYQPKVALADESLSGFEALLRWRHDSLGILGPAELWAAFEDMNLSAGLGERMLDRVCDDMRAWLDRGLDFGKIAINVSPTAFRRADLPDLILGHLHRYGLSPERLELEVTESVFMGSGADAVRDVLKNLHEAGMSIALDDFGTGYASLTHLQAFPIDVIKIDRSFVTNLAAGSANAAIVDAIIGLGDRLGMKVVAEGIETRSEADHLLERGCGYGQGYLFGRAAGRDEVQRLLLRQGERGTIG